VQRTLHNMNSPSLPAIFGGHLLGVRGANTLSFYDWETVKLVRRIDIDARNVIWAENGTLVTIIGPESFFILKFSKEVSCAVGRLCACMPSDCVKTCVCVCE
jgi:hypothetical protein